MCVCVTGVNACINHTCAHLCLPSPIINNQSPAYQCVCDNNNNKTCVNTGMYLATLYLKESVCMALKVNSLVLLIVESSATSVSMTTTSPLATSVASNLTVTQGRGQNRTTNKAKQPQPQQIQRTENRNSTLTLAGGATGVLATVALVSLVVWRLCRHHRRRHMMNYDNPMYHKTTDDVVINNQDNSHRHRQHTVSLTLNNQLHPTSVASVALSPRSNLLVPESTVRVHFEDDGV